MKNTIGLDIDGCLNNYHRDLLDFIELKYNLKAPSSEYCAVDLLNLSPQEENDFWREFNDVSLSLKVLDGAIEALNKIREYYDIDIITARFYHASKCTEIWLDSNEIRYNNLYFNAGDKLDVCKWKNIEIMIEDNPHNAMILANNNIKVLLIDHLYNREVEHENIIRCKTWNEIWSVISLNI